MLAYCGLQCLKCPAYLATQADDNKLRSDCAQRWSEWAKITIRPEQINCDGCKAGGRLFFFCNSCGVRKCAVEKGIDTCALCPDYVCKKLQDLMQLDPNIRKSIEAQKRKSG
ncbi:MAG: DUF3795 domain-containing protein [Dehalococcoidia bacterium]|jgi:hypothetical protein